MPSPKPPPDDEPLPGPATPHRPSPAGAKHLTPTHNNSNDGASPSSNGRKASAGAGANRQRSSTMKPQPTLLSDFLLGRQTPARVAAARRRSVDAAAVRAELRQEMRQASVRKLQQPGGVRDRVKNWQKNNAAAMAIGDPEATPTEPTEVGFQLDDVSVTEEDRIRIKMRQRAKRRSAPQVHHKVKSEGSREESKDGQDNAEGDWEEEEGDDVPEHTPRTRSPPKKRIVSDEHWMKKRRKSPPRATPPRAKPEGSPIPKDFLQRTAQNPTVQNKIKDWATRVEPPESPRVKKYSTKDGDTVTVEEDAESGRKSNDEGLRVRPVRKRRTSPKEAEDTNSSPKPRKTYEDDGIRVTPSDSSLPDDGIRIRPGPKSADDDTSSVKRTSERGRRVPSARRERSPSERIEVFEEPGSTVDTPTRKPKSRKASKSKKSQVTSSFTGTHTDDVTETTTRQDEDSPSSVGDHSSDGRSYEPSSAPGKSLADIPFGYSAFSELDLPHGASASRRPKAQRNPSLKAVPKVLKKVMSEGKKIIHNQVDPPKPVVNQPPSIESWLSGTVDPFVDAPAPRKNSVEEDWKHEAKRRSTSASRDKEPKEAKEPSPPPPPAPPKVAKEEEKPKESEGLENQENISPKEPGRKEVKPETPSKDDPGSTTPKSSGLKRSMATRSVASPLKTGSAKKTFREALREAFRGESGGHNFMPTTYHTVQEDPLPDDEDGSERYEPSRRRSSGGSRGRSPSPDPTLSTITESTITESTSQPVTYPKRKPPTNGMHELSTIVSEASYSTHESDTMSTVSQTTITQSTALTPTDLSRQKSNKSGLKRRLTKHSDLVSVLSLPDDSQLPARTRSIRVARSLHRKTSKLDNATLEDLLREFAEDENLYSRELKTLVDGVVPVLLTQFVHGDARRHTDLFDPKSASHKADSLSKSVVNMGIALEKLRNFHKRVPLHDAQALLAWLESVYPVYDNYLDVWRLGFQDLIVNLAPLIRRFDDEDSLVGAMPLNEEGDVLDENGERVDVAHLLKRPLVRIKWMLKFAKGARLILGGFIDGEIVNKLETLQEKARRRHREEMARKADEDAYNTDPTRARDLRTLAPISSVHIDRSRQVYAKDWFSLDLSHSNGQRLDCQVEVVFRDKADDRRDPGDVLIRETGNNGQSWLLFPPVPAGQISARAGQAPRSLVIMIRGTHNMKEWYELITITADDDEAATEWLDILGTSPIPPKLATPGATAMSRTEDKSLPRAPDDDIPLGEPSVIDEPQASPTTSPSLDGQKLPKTPSRYHQRRQSRPTTPTSAHAHPNGENSPDKTPTQSTYHKSPALYDSRHSSPDDSSRPLREDMRPDAAKLAKSSPNSTPFRQDGAPPPPIHRTLTPKKSSSVSPPVELTSSSRVKRRTSSPLKHEYHPSDVSSEGSASSEGSGSESDDSSSDELEEDDIPDTLPGISIRKPELCPTESVISDSSITPSHSASQVGVYRTAEGETEYTTKCVAVPSYWSSRKGQWKPIGEKTEKDAKDEKQDPCSIVISPGLLEVYPLDASHSNRRSPGRAAANDDSMSRPLIALDLTPVVMIRQSTSLDLEIRSPVRSYSKLNNIESSIFRFRASSAGEMSDLYNIVHKARLENAKFKALEEEARFRSFGQTPAAATEQGDDTSSRRRSWFGRKNSYRASTRAPSQSQGSSSSVSASSFLKRLTGGGNMSFNIDKSSVDKQSRVGSGSGGTSLYTSGSSSASGGTPPRSPSVSLAEGSTRGLKALGSDNLKIRCHLAVSASKWEDQGNCMLQITRPPPGMRQELNLYHGMEKRIIVTSIPKKDSERPLVVLDVVLGSRCFGRLGTRGIVLNVWEDLRDENNMVGMVPKAGALSGKVKKWCFQCSSAREASWILALVAQEVVIS